MFWCDYARSVAATWRAASWPRRGWAPRTTCRSASPSGSLAANADTGEIQTRFNKEDWSNLDENDDYSFDPSKTAFADWHKVTLYLDGMLIWGQEPPPP